MSRTNHIKISILVIHLASLVAGQVYSGCEEDVYYSALSTGPSRTEIGNLLRSTHRNVLPYTSNREDTWDALMDLDPGSQPNTVRLIYSDHEPIGQLLSGQSRTWNREHLWPKSRGVGFDGADFVSFLRLSPLDGLQKSNNIIFSSTDCFCRLTCTICDRRMSKSTPHGATRILGLAGLWSR